MISNTGGTAMDFIIQEKCDAFLSSFKVLRESETFGAGEMILAAAGYYTSMGKQPDTAKLERCREVFRKNEALFSDLRGNMEYMIRCKMAMADDPEDYLSRLRTVYKKIHPSIIGDDQTVLEAMTIVDYAVPEAYDEMIAGAKEIYREMRNAHVFLTAENDKPFAALMAVLGTDPKTTHDRAEYAFKKLKDRFGADKDTVQTISHILSVSDADIDETCAKVCIIAEKLRAAGIRFGGNRRASILAALADLGVSSEELAKQIADADNYLKDFEPFTGLFGENEKTRHMFAVQCVHSAYSVFGQSVPATVSSSVELSIVLDIMLALILVSLPSAGMTRSEASARHSSGSF